MTYTPPNPEVHHSTLVDAICYELQHYGPQSLIEITKTLIEQLPEAETDPRLEQIVTVLQRASDTLPAMTIRMNEEA